MAHQPVRRFQTRPVQSDRDHHQSSNFVRIIDCVHECQRRAPRMTNKNRSVDAQLCERAVKQLCLNFDRRIAALWSLATAVTGTIESDDSMTRGQRRKYRHPILHGTRVAVNENDGTTRAFDNEVKISVVNFDENGFGERVIVHHSRRDVLLFKSTGYAHNRSIGGLLL